MLPHNPPQSQQETSAKVIPLRRSTTSRGISRQNTRWDASQGEKYTLTQTRVASRRASAERGSRDDARHYLKFMLPGIPVTTFVLTFLYGYLLQGVHTLVLNGHATEQSYTPAVDPTLPLIGALLVAFATGMLCLTIYWGYQRISERGAHAAQRKSSQV